MVNTCSFHNKKMNKFEWLVLLTFLALIIFGITDFNESYNSLPVSLFLDILVVTILASSISNLKMININIFLIFIFVSIYLGISFISSFVYNKDLFIDFFLAYKLYFYLFFLLISSFKKVFSKEFFYTLYRFLLWSLNVKYIISIIFFSIYRPGLFTENNYEILSISIFFIFNLNINKHLFSKSDIFMYILSVSMSASRSGFIILILIFFINWKTISNLINFPKYKFLFILTLPFFIFTFLIVIFRFSNISSIDRVQFFYVFLDEFNNFSFFEKLFGPARLTTLKSDSLNQLSHFVQYNMASHKDSSLAYPFILTPFIFRTLLTHGIIFSILSIYIMYKLLIYNSIPHKVSLQIILITLFNGFSVSGFQSVFFFLPFLLICFSKSNYYK